jgi:hypothetical protein
MASSSQRLASAKAPAPAASRPACSKARSATALQQLWPAEQDQQERDRGPHAEQRFDEIEQAIRSMVEAIDDDEAGSAPGTAFNELLPAGPMSERQYGRRSSQVRSSKATHKRRQLQQTS